MSVALVNPNMLNWARERAGFSLDALAKKLQVKPEQVYAWEQGKKSPTFKQAQNLAKSAYVPFGFLFLSKPPQEELPIPDLRTVEGRTVMQASLELRDTLRDVYNKHAWYLEYLRLYNEADPLPFVGRYTLTDTPQKVAKNMHDVLALHTSTLKLNRDNYFKTLVNAAESQGVLVMQSGIALGNTHRKLDVAEFRGFAISDPVAPLVFINSADAPAARLFTLAHELAHIWLGCSGISDTSPKNNRREEVFCNAVAAEFLVPEASFKKLWNNAIEWRSNLEPLSVEYRVSKLVIGRRALTLNFITAAMYQEFYLQEMQRFRDQKQDSSGGNYYATTTLRNSRRLSQAVVSEAYSGRMLLRNAAQILGIKPNNLKEYGERLKG